LKDSFRVLWVIVGNRRQLKYTDFQADLRSNFISDKLGTRVSTLWVSPRSKLFPCLYWAFPRTRPAPWYPRGGSTVWRGFGKSHTVPVSLRPVPGPIPPRTCDPCSSLAVSFPSRANFVDRPTIFPPSELNGIFLNRCMQRLYEKFRSDRAPAVGVWLTQVRGCRTVVQGVLEVDISAFFRRTRLALIPSQEHPLQDHSPNAILFTYTSLYSIHITGGFSSRQRDFFFGQRGVLLLLVKSLTTFYICSLWT
jgi:hypothetical protein